MVAMPEGGISVTSHKSLVTSYSSLLSNLWWQLRCHIYGAMPEGKWIAGFPFGISNH